MPDKEMITAKVLKRGDTVGIVAPSSPYFEAGYLEYSLAFLEKIGLKYKVGKHVFDAWGTYAGADEDRAKDLHKFFADSEIQAILPICGGNGAVRLLPYLDFSLIKNNPKILVGFSDITGLLIPIMQETGLVTFHGPTAMSFFRTNFTYDHFLKALMHAEPLGALVDPREKEIWNPPYPPPRLVIATGQARGRLTGGCLTLIRQLMGTPYQMQTEGKILFLEDVAEEPHAVDRMLSQMALAGLFQKCAGIIVGECVECRPGESKRNIMTLNYSVEEVLRERLGGLGVPVVYGMRFGHGDNKWTLPLGVMASLNATHDGVSFVIEESATRVRP